ncbi:MAG: peptidyl-prolyl cis-trans isomerase [Acidobacteria bacterium]|nr:peptidyl-prolyl cis-trans isomerase [Acidobacteriota bacterium]
MTMLDKMRRRKNLLKWSLALVVVSFILLYVPAFIRSGGGPATSSDVVAQVEGHEVTAGDFQRAYQGQLQAYRSAYGSNISEQLLKQLGIEQQILQQMVDERAAIAEAERLGIQVSDEEVGDRIRTMPAFQVNGQFMGEERYRQLLNMQRPPISYAEFEESLRRSMTVERLRAALTDWVTVADTELEKEFRRRNEKVKLQLLAFRTDDFRGKVGLAEPEVAAYFDTNKDKYRVGEQRKVRYLLVDVDAIKARVSVSQRDLERYYNDNIEQYSTPEQVRASHILLKTEGKDEAAVRATAEKLAQEARGGADFAALAKKHSEDEASKEKGGDLDYFPRGRMVAEFDEKAFSMQPGTVSDPVKTQYGFHIIKMVDKKAATTRTLDEVKAQITDQVGFQRAQSQAAQLAEKLEAQISKPGDLETVARANGFSAQETGFFRRDEPILGLGAGPDISQRAFELKDGEVTGHLRVPRGFVFLAPAGKKDPYLPKLDEAKDKVRDDLTREKATALAKQRAAEVKGSAKGDLAAAAKAAGIELKTTELVARDAALPEIGVSAAADRVAFALPVGEVSDPIVTDTATVVIKVLERRDTTREEFAAGKEQLRDDLLAERRNRFFSSYMVKAKQRMEIQINREVLGRLIGI